MKPGVKVSWDDLSGTGLLMLENDRSAIRCCKQINKNQYHSQNFNKVIPYCTFQTIVADVYLNIATF
jgi:hypothetical protein